MHVLMSACSNCGELLDPERAALPYITVCRPCADDGIIDRACVVIVGQHKGQPLVCSPEQATNHSYRK